MQLAQPRRQLVGADRHQDEVVSPHLGIQPGDAAHLDAQQDAGGDQLGALAQPPDRVAADLEMLAGFDQRDVDATLQLREIVADDLDPMAQGPQHRCRRVLL